MNTFNILTCIEELCVLGERQEMQATKASKLIQGILSSRNIPFSVDRIETAVPTFKESTLTADGASVPCVATSFVSGSISSNYALISSLTSSQPFLYTPNINFNPRCQGSISRSNHYFAPSLAIAREDVVRVIEAEEVKGEVHVEKTPYTQEQILVGNKKNPSRIVFCHYDSVGPGATDNASGVATTLAVLLDKPEQLSDTLFVFDGNEELSYDEPIYWGSGYRAFEKNYAPLLEEAKKILVVDCVGQTSPVRFTDPAIVKLAFPLTRREEFSSKIVLIAGDYDALMRVYQSEIDLPSVLSEINLNAAQEMLRNELSN